MRLVHWLRLPLAGVVGCLLTGGCPPVQPTQTSDNKEAALKPFADGTELVAYFRQQATAVNTPRGGVLGVLPMMFGGAAPMAEQTSGNGADTSGQQAGGTSYSTTNLQEEGVDESDVLKSGGTYFYIAKGATLRIVKATPLAELDEVGRLAFDVPIDSMYLFGGKLLVLGQKYTLVAPQPGQRGMPETMMWPPYYAGASVVVSEVDVSDPGTPAVTATNELDGSLVSSRLTNNRLIMVLTITPTLPTPLNALTINTVTVDDVLPQMRTVAGAAPLVTPENWYHPESPDGYNTTAVVTLDAADIGTVVGSVAVMANAGTVYASTEAVYLTDTAYDYAGNGRETTAVHKLAFDKDGVARYTASGSVPGRLLNQFSLGEYNGYLRLATHVDNWMVAVGVPGVAVAEAASTAPRAQNAVDAGTGSSGTGDAATGVTATPEQPWNGVYVLGEQDGKLEVVGSVEGIAPGENLYAARFIGARGFLVTFQQIDPLFVLDLATPSKPAVVGELKIPGYSDYLHPLGDNLLIGVGQSTTTAPWGGTLRNGVQLSLFDVSDLANPTLIDQLELGGYGSTTDVSWTHKAFAILPDRGLLAIPAQLYDASEQNPETWSWGQQLAFDGVVCFSIDPAAGFTEVGRVASVIYKELGWTDWHRPAFIGDAVYAVTPAGVSGAALDDFTHPQTLELEPNEGELTPYMAGGGGGSTEPSAPPPG